jgi:hypothetical protein
MRLIRLAEQYFSRAIESGRTRISNIDLHEHVSRLSGQHRSVVHGTLDSMSSGSLYTADWYVANWHKELEGTHVIHVFGPDKGEEVEDNSYLKTILDNVDPNDLVITADIDSEELAHLHPNVKSIGVYETPNEECKLFNANTGGGYAARKLIDFLQVLVREKKAEIIALTVAKLDNFRNVGEFQDGLRTKYAESVDKHAQCIADQMEGYEMSDRFVFRKKDNSMPLETFVFVREGD